MSDKVREQFEAWWVAEYESHTYQHDDAHNMAWEGWLASRAAALEEAEEAVDAVEPVRYTEDDGSRRVDGTDTIAACVLAIRALAGRGA